MPKRGPLLGKRTGALKRGEIIRDLSDDEVARLYDLTISLHDNLYEEARLRGLKAEIEERPPPPPGPTH